MADVSVSLPLATDGEAAAPKQSLIKRVLPRSLFGRSMMIIVTPLILVQAVTTFVFFDRHWDTVIARLSEGLANDFVMVVNLATATPHDRTDAFPLAASALRLDLRWQAGAKLDPALPRVSDNFLGHAVGPRLERRLYYPFQIDVSPGDREVTLRVEFPDGLLTIEGPRERLFNSTFYLFLIWMVGSALVLFVVAVIFMRNQVRAVRRLAAAADTLGKGQEVLNFKPEGATEVRLAAAAFFRMRDRIQRQVARRTEMLAGVSHDLRTPLTRMKLQLAMLGDTQEIEDLKADVAEMEAMVEGYLAFARGEGEEASEPTDLGELLTDVAGQATRRGIALRTDLAALPTLDVRPQALRRCVTNLIENAARYGTLVSLRASHDRGAVRILVDDDGPGIPTDKRDEVFKPFFRLDSSRNRATGGVGLGLTIARDVVHGHGGDINLQESPRGGLRVVLSLPA